MKMSYYMVSAVAIMALLAAGVFVAYGNNEAQITGNIISENPDLNDDPSKVTVYFFWGDGCPHCAAEKPFLEQMEQKYPELEVKMFETWHSQENAELFVRMAQAYGTTAQGVPTTFLDDKVWVGYADYMGEEIEDKVKYCLENDCISPGNKLKGA